MKRAWSLLRIFEKRFFFSIKVKEIIKGEDEAKKNYR